MLVNSSLPALRLIGIHKSYGETQALNGVSVDVAEGELISLLGPSGCGKSTLLMIIAGLETADQGEVFWKGKKFNSVAPHQRGFGLMFQDYVLFPHMDVYRNVAFGLEMTGFAIDEIRNRVQESLKLVGLEGFEERDVNSLSGGEQQRVALARALAPRPRLLMLDEPLGSVDRTLRERLLEELHRILHNMKLTAIYVTHDQEEAFTIADRIILMRSGKIEQSGTPQEIYHKPASLFAAQFLGLTNLVPGESQIKNGQAYIETGIGSFPVSGETSGRVYVLIPPNSIQLNGSGEYLLTGKILAKTFRGDLVQVELRIGDDKLTFNFLSSTRLPEVGESLTVSVDSFENLLVFPRDQET